MIIFIDLGEQILEGYNKHFAWFDTITDTFEEYNGSQVWESWEEFEEDFNADPNHSEMKPLERYKSLFKWKK